MLYNPNWNKPAPVLSLEGLRDWLKTQPADKEYDYSSQTGCLLAQYFKAKKYRFVSVSSQYFEHGWCSTSSIPYQMNAVASRSKTFGEALRRAEEKLS